VSRHLVTGGAGFVGSALAHRLVAEGHEVTVLDRFSRGKQHRVPKEAEIVKGDIRNLFDVEVAARHADVIWHLAYVQGTQTFYADPKDVIDVALHGIVNVLDCCEQWQGKELFLVSSSEAYQTPPEGMFPTDETVPLSVPDVTNPRYSYGGGKIASELATLAYAQAGLLKRAVIVRPHNIYGPDMGVDHVIPQFALRMMELKGRKFPIQGTGKETRSFCYISDCIDGLMRLYGQGEDREVYHLGNPFEEYAIEDLALEVADWFGVEIDVIPGELPKGSPTRRLPDISKLAELGYDPKVSLVEGLRATLRWYSESQQVAA
jgi:nucleoside-diphosphate-sugar epimerase